MFCGGKSGFVKAKHNFVQLERTLIGIYLQEIEILIEMKIGQIAMAAAMMAVSCRCSSECGDVCYCEDCE